MGLGDPNLNPPPAPPAPVEEGAPKVQVDPDAEFGAVEVAGPGAGDDPKVKVEGGLAAVEAGVGVEEPNVKLGVLAAGVVFCGESSIISLLFPPAPAPAPVVLVLVLVLVVGVGLGAPKPPNPPVVLPKPVLDEEGVPNENPPVLAAGGLLASLPLVDAGAPKENVGVVEPDPGAEAGALSDAGLDAPNENVDEGVDSGAGLLAVVLPKLNPLGAGLAASVAGAGFGVPKLNPADPDAEAGAEVAVDSAGLPNENSPENAVGFEAASVALLSPFAPKKFGMSDLGVSSFFSLVVGVPKLKLLDEAAAGAEEEEVEPKEKLGILFFAAGSLSLSAPRLGPVEAAAAEEAPKVNPPELAVLEEAPNENPPVLEAAAAAGASAGLPVSNFFIVLPKKLGTGPSFFASLSEVGAAGSAGLLKKSEAGGAFDLFASAEAVALL